MEASTATTAPVLRTGARQVFDDYLQLTKPKVQSLLLLTTVTTMLVAGSPSLGLILLTCLGGYLSAGGAGAVNHFYDRDIDARMERTADRPVPSGRVSPRAALTFGLALSAASFVLMSTTINVLAASLSFAGFVGYVGRLHDVAQTPHGAEHRHRRSRRCRPAARRLGGGDRQRLVDRGLPLRDRVLLDAAALLGAEHPHEGGVRQGRGPHAAGRPR